MSLPARIEAKIDRSGTCHRWTGAHDSDGYGRVRWDGDNRKAHRVVFELTVGPIPEGHDIDHVKDRGCVYRDCVNVEHLEPVTHRENLLRGDTITARNAVVTHCPRGHSYATEGSTHKRGFRYCKRCARERMMRKRTSV